jgi:D-arabinose 1-dehydrogenase-like Zn-dependent alcohol dehydrogenase
VTRAVELRGTDDTTTPSALTLVELPTPVPDPGEVVVGVRVALLGPDDLSAWPSLPRTVGREAVGVVTTLGPGVHDWHPGDRVALPALVPCGSCGPCRAGRTTLCADRRRPGRDAPGLLATEVAVRADLLHHVPPELPAAEGAVVPGAVATAYHALKRGGVGPEVTAVVVGADAVGLHLTQLAALAGGEVVTVDTRSAARERALELGADVVIDPDEGPLADRIADRLGDRADRVLVTPAATTSVEESLGLVRSGGRVVLVDRPVTDEATVPLRRLVDEELDLVGAPGTATPQDVAELFDLAAEDRLVLGTTVVGEVELDDDLAQVPQLLGDTGLRVAVRVTDEA